jgi:hypothetical protein
MKCLILLFLILQVTLNKKCENHESCFDVSNVIQLDKGQMLPEEVSYKPVNMVIQEFESSYLIHSENPVNSLDHFLNDLKPNPGEEVKNYFLLEKQNIEKIEASAATHDGKIPSITIFEKERKTIITFKEGISGEASIKFTNKSYWLCSKSKRLKMKQRKHH